MNILIADDDAELCQLLKQYLEQEGMVVETATDGISAIERLKIKAFDLLILDVMMPRLNGFDTLRTLRVTSDIAIIMLTAKGEKVDRITGLEMGADDYLAKPCDPDELIARIRAVTRRSQATKADKQATQVGKQDDEVITLDNLTIIKTSRQVLLNNELLALTTTEYDLLLLLTDKAGILVSRENLSELGLGKPLQIHDRSIDVHISHLRKKLGEDVFGRERIKTVRGTGYQYLTYPDAQYEQSQL